MTKPITDFYDRLSLEYRKNMGWDWEAGLRKEGVTLDKFLVSQLGRPGPYSLLDCSCGIGTQAIGLALQGHQVHATDLSPVSIDCARRESADFDAFAVGEGGLFVAHGGGLRRQAVLAGSQGRGRA